MVDIKVVGINKTTFNGSYNWYRLGEYGSLLLYCWHKCTDFCRDIFVYSCLAICHWSRSWQKIAISSILGGLFSGNSHISECTCSYNHIWQFVIYLLQTSYENIEFFVWAFARCRCFTNLSVDCFGKSIYGCPVLLFSI